MNVEKIENIAHYKLVENISARVCRVTARHKQGRFRLLPQGDSQGSEKHASLENTLVRFKPDTKKCHNIFCQFMTTVHVL